MMSSTTPEFEHLWQLYLLSMNEDKLEDVAKEASGSLVSADESEGFPEWKVSSLIIHNYQNDAFLNIELQLNTDVATRDTWIPFQRCNGWFPWSFCGAKPVLIFSSFLDGWKKINNNYDDYLRWQWWWMLQGKGTSNICFRHYLYYGSDWTYMNNYVVITVMMIWWLWENEFLSKTKDLSLVWWDQPQIRPSNLDKR